MRGTTRCALVALAAVISWPADAAAQRRDRERAEAETDDANEERGGGDAYDDWTPYAMRDEIAFDARWWSADLFGSTFAFMLGGQGMVTDNVAVGFYLPWTFNVRSSGDPIAAFGNPTLDVHYADQVDIVTWHVGGGISAPLASIEDDSNSYRFAALFALNSNAAYDSHLFIPAFMPLRAYGGVEIRPVRGVSIQLGLDPMVFIPIEGQDVEVLLQEHVDVIALSEPGFGGGLRFQGVHPLTGGGDLAQLSIEPYLAYDDQSDFFVKLGLLMALDTPAGFAFDQGKVLALHLNIGGYTDGDDEGGL
jgi:hypothetical protein